MNTLSTAVQIGRYTLRNRMIMAPMTRSRADDANGVQSELAVTYYRQRATAGLIVTEGVFPSAMGKGYVRTPGIYSDEQVAAWKKVTEAVHAEGGRIFMQLMHTGRISHPSMLPGGALPVAPSAIKPAGQSFTAYGMADFVTPRALETSEVAAVVEEYRLATRRALEAGFDGVELHAASGYLPEQFLSSGSNRRSDQYGGSIANRARFILEVLDAMVAEAGSDRVGIKISPEMGFNDIKDDAPVETYAYLVRQLAPLNLAYLHVAKFKAEYDYHAALRPLFNGAYILGGGQTSESGEQRIAAGEADAVAYGSAFLANPDLPRRFALQAPLNTPNPALFYAPGAQGYIDYPALADASANRALRIHAYGGEEVMQWDDVPAPQPGAGEVLVRVAAAGVNGLDWKIRDGLVKDVFQLPLPATLGLELAGEVAAVGAGVEGYATGDRVFGALGGLGAYAGHVAVAVSKLAATPVAMDDATAAAIPVAAMTAWQALFETGQLQRGETVLIHGAAGGVGSYAVQFAKQAGVRVLVTAQGRNADLLRSLGADEVIDYKTTRFNDVAKNVDLVFDLVGGETLDRSWQVLSPQGRIVSVAAPDIAQRVPDGRRGSWHAMHPDGALLARIAAQVVSGELTVVVSEVVTTEQAAAAIERNKTGHGAGKTVVRF
ncbi:MULTISPECIES: zinc-binding dehydrogenase [unclassified Duganella]|uniref:oxidoreductase n=1 Tax=unclassified Duganella TaxID=2636909 RepID=UPI000E3579C2|nr:MULTISPECIES: zinc-binding dehydrogenase [unclassified Duganella]RFP11186.1 N-ethylmaleimide reductase NemA [Duganella sp. BJB475]RFP29505.1 N-ethylmaleimide reductase NemA [Duganella sp. BJB476]